MCRNRRHHQDIISPFLLHHLHDKGSLNDKNTPTIPSLHETWSAYREARREYRETRSEWRSARREAHNRSHQERRAGHHHDVGELPILSRRCHHSPALAQPGHHSFCTGTELMRVLKRSVKGMCLRCEDNCDDINQYSSREHQRAENMGADGAMEEGIIPRSRNNSGKEKIYNDSFSRSPKDEDIRESNLLLDRNVTNYYSSHQAALLTPNTFDHEREEMGQPPPKYETVVRGMA